MPQMCRKGHLSRVCKNSNVPSVEVDTTHGPKPRATLMHQCHSLSEQKSRQIIRIFKKRGTEARKREVLMKGLAAKRKAQAERQGVRAEDKVFAMSFTNREAEAKTPALIYLYLEWDG